MTPDFGGHGIINPVDPVGFGGHKIINLADPVNPQDMVTKAYVDSVFAAKEPADIPLISFPHSPWGTHDQIRGEFQKLLNLGLNAIQCYRHIEDYRDESYATDRYDARYNIAAEMGIKINQYTGCHRLHYVGKKTGEKFVERYMNFPACWGFQMEDEPALKSWPHEGCVYCMNLAHSQGAGPPDHPYYPVWNYGITYEQYKYTCRPNWCECYDIGCVDCYPTALRGSGWKEFLEFWVNKYYHTDDNDGFGDCGKGMIPVIQAHVEITGPGTGMLPDIVGEYNVWKDKYGYDNIKGIGFWLPYPGDGCTGFLGGGDGALRANLQEQIKDVARLRGWGG